MIGARAIRPMMKVCRGRLVRCRRCRRRRPGRPGELRAEGGARRRAVRCREFASRNDCELVASALPRPTCSPRHAVTTQVIVDTVLGRVGQVQEVAATVAFLASQPAGYITGAVIPVDGTSGWAPRRIGLGVTRAGGTEPQQEADISSIRRSSDRR